MFSAETGEIDCILIIDFEGCLRKRLTNCKEITDRRKIGNLRTKYK